MSLDFDGNAGRENLIEYPIHVGSKSRRREPFGIRHGLTSEDHAGVRLHGAQDDG